MPPWPRPRKPAAPRERAAPCEVLRAAAAGAALAALPRLAVALWAPTELHGDGRFDHAHALAFAAFGRYLHPDGSPAVHWMPGWPALLTALYALTGQQPRAAMLLEAGLDSLSAGLVAALGARLFGLRVGWLSGALYALWPGMILFTGTLFSEPLFVPLLLTRVLLVAHEPGALPPWWRPVGAGLALAAACWVKSEPLALLPALLFAVRRLAVSRRAALRAALPLVLLALAPWTWRNYQLFGVFLPTGTNGGIVLQLANRVGATGGADIRRTSELIVRYAAPTHAETELRRHAAGPGDAWRFATEHPDAIAPLDRAEAAAHLLRRRRRAPEHPRHRPARGVEDRAGDGGMARRALRRLLVRGARRRSGRPGRVSRLAAGHGAAAARTPAHVLRAARRPAGRRALPRARGALPRGAGRLRARPRARRPPPRHLPGAPVHLPNAVLKMLRTPGPRQKESNLVPDDFDLALRRLKTDLALLDLRRELIHKPLGPREVMALTDRILELQQHGV
jgi:hypothetical protein